MSIVTAVLELTENKSVHLITDRPANRRHDNDIYYIHAKIIRKGGGKSPILESSQDIKRVQYVKFRKYKRTSTNQSIQK